MKRLKGLEAVMVFCVATAAIPAWGVDGVAVSAGNGDDTDMFRVAAQWNWQKTWFKDKPWYLGGYWDLSLARWHGHSTADDNQGITEVGVTPVFRLQRNVGTGPVPFFEGAIGLHLLSGTTINANRHFSTHFQFGDHLGAGMLFGIRRQYEIAYLLQHLSNGGIRNPNPGINFSEIRFGYHF